MKKFTPSGIWLKAKHKYGVNTVRKSTLIKAREVEMS